MQPVSDRLIVSVFDKSGQWAAPYARAGYRVQLWDLEHEGCILQHFDRLLRIIDGEECGLHGLLLAPPCTDFASSGAQWWKAKDRQRNPGDPWRRLDYSLALVDIGLHLVELYRPQWWVMEQPIGRLPTLRPELAAVRAMEFDPCQYGDPYTKRTVLYGQFNTALPLQPCLFTLPHIHTMPDTAARAAKRSITPSGFASAFFAANP